MFTSQPQCACFHRALSEHNLLHGFIHLPHLQQIGFRAKGNTWSLDKAVVNIDWERFLSLTTLPQHPTPRTLKECENTNTDTVFVNLTHLFCKPQTTLTLD